MKNIIISLLLLTPFLAGCTNIDSQLTLNDDKSASIVTSLAYEGNLLNQADKVAQTVTNNYEKFLDPIYNVETVYSDKLSTITATKSVKNVQHADLDLSSLGFKSNLPDGKFVEVKKNFLVTSFNIDLTYDYPAQVSKIQKVEQKVDAAKGTKGLQPEYLQKYGDASEIQPADVDAREDFSEHLDPSAKVLIKEDDADAVAETDNSKQDDKMNMSFSVKVPSFASYNNADSMNLNVYTWNILRDKPTVIKLQYVQYSGFAIAFVILVGILVLVLLARKILKHDTQKRIDN